ncbi:MAG: translation initiation factor [Candidatus Parvarchaeota archaeon]|nr:translation initiation factor [Candidatus Parvarchaeota archaeon]
MTEVCSVCGLPKDLCICGTISQESQKIRVYTKRVSFKKVVTIVSGIDPKVADLKSIAKQLKNKLACGGTFKEDLIELQGDHTDKVKKMLVEYGFPESAFL